MTKRRDPLTFHRALTKVAALIGWDSAAAICGVGERTVRYWSDPDCETEIRLIDAERLDRAFLAAGGTVAPFHQVYSLRLGIAAKDQEPARIDLVHIAAGAAKESGEAVSAMIAASGIDASPRAIKQAREEIEEAIAIMTTSLAALKLPETQGEAS